MIKAATMARTSSLRYLLQADERRKERSIDKDVIYIVLSSFSFSCIEQFCVFQVPSLKRCLSLPLPSNLTRTEDRGAICIKVDESDAKDRNTYSTEELSECSDCSETVRDSIDSLGCLSYMINECPKSEITCEKNHPFFPEWVLKWDSESGFLYYKSVFSGATRWAVPGDEEWMEPLSRDDCNCNECVSKEDCCHDCLIHSLTGETKQLISSKKPS